MNRPSDEFLARAGLTDEEHAAARRRHQASPFVNSAHGRTVTHNSGQRRIQRLRRWTVRWHECQKSEIRFRNTIFRFESVSFSRNEHEDRKSTRLNSSH